jgi:hypothetical protein
MKRNREREREKGREGFWKNDEKKMARTVFIEMTKKMSSCPVKNRTCPFFWPSFKGAVKTGHVPFFWPSFKGAVKKGHVLFF